MRMTFEERQRLSSDLHDAIKARTTWVLTVPFDEQQLSRFRREVYSFLLNKWHYEEVLYGATEEEAFYVICDYSNNTPESLISGKVICDVGVAVFRPAEFVTFQVVHQLATLE